MPIVQEAKNSTMYASSLFSAPLSLSKEEALTTYVART